MNSIYLKSDPINWLLEKSDPSVRYLTLRDIINNKDYEKEYNNLFNSIEIKSLLQTETDGILGNKTKFDLYYKGSMWCFAEAVERGLDRRSDLIDRTTEYITSISQMPSGGFTLNWKPETEVSCRTGDMVKYLILAGYSGEKIEKGISWIIRNQRHDGGWLHCPLAGMCDMAKLTLFNKAGKGLNREKDENVSSCIYGTIACSMALIEYKHRINSEKYSLPEKKAVDFFLNKKLFKTAKNKPIKPKNKWNSDFRLLGYPIMSQYDILYGLIFIAKSGNINDSRTGEAFNIVISRQNDNGTWNLETAQTGMMYGNSKKPPIGMNNKWVTLNILRLLKYI